jgi:hypothetical protein
MLGWFFVFLLRSTDEARFLVLGRRETQLLRYETAKIPGALVRVLNSEE